MDPGTNVTVVADGTAIAEHAAQIMLDAARAAAGARGRFMIALAGGATPRATYARLALPPFVDQIPWAKTWVFFGDERAVGPEHPESNYRMASDALLSKVPIPPEQIVRMRGEAEDLDAAAAKYARQLTETFGTRRGEIPRFDLVLLGLGVDGHTASLFPGSPVLKEIFRTVVAVHAAAAVIPERITLTLPVFMATRRGLFLASGPEKSKVLKAVLVDRVRLPATMVHPTDGRLDWVVDRDAARLLDATTTRSP